MQNRLEKMADFFSCYSKTAWEKDIDGMINLYDDDVTIFDMWDEGFSLGLKGWSSSINGWLTSLQDERVKVLFGLIEIREDEHIGFASALIQFQAISAEGSIVRSMKNRISLGFVKNDGFWKVKHQHTSAPIDANLKAILDI